MSADTRTDPPTPDPLTAEDREFEAQHDPFAVVLSKAFHEAASHYLPWPDSLSPCPSWVRHLALMEAIVERPEVLAALPSAPDQRLREAAQVADEILSFVQPSPDAEPDYLNGKHYGLRLAAGVVRQYAALSEATTSPEATLDVERLRAAKFVAGHWLDAVMSSEPLRNTGMSHPLAMVLAALDGETDPRQLGLPPSLDEEFARLRGPA